MLIPTTIIRSGSIGSGALASGSVYGFFGPTRDIASGTVGVSDFGSGAVIAGTVGSGAIRSGNIASGQVGPNSLASGIITSGFWVGSGTILGQAGGGPFNIASGSLDNFDLSSGIITSGVYIGSGTIMGQKGGGPFQIASGSIGTNDIGSGQVQSGNVLSGNIFRFHLSSGSVYGLIGNQSQHIASGTVGAGNIGSGSIRGNNAAGTATFQHLASGTIDKFNCVSGLITSGVYIGSGTILGQAGGGPFNIASGTITTNDLGSGAITSGLIGSGQVGNFAVSSGAVTSGRLGVGGTPTGTNFLRDDFTWASPGAASVTSGAVIENTFASGAGPEYLMAFVSGLTNPNPVITEEAISGVRAVCISQSGNIRIAMASVSGRMPAVGVVFDNVASGIQCNVYENGDFQFSSGLADYSGYLGQLVFVGRSGQVVSSSGSFNSGGLLSGDIVQPLGVVLNSGSAELSVVALPPFVPSLVYSGNIGSGQIGGVHLASGAITSGFSIGSGTIWGRVGPTFLIASGTIGTLDLSSGIITSGVYIGSGAIMGQQGGGPFHIASGTLGKFNLSSGIITSGVYIGSGTIGGQIGGTPFHIFSGTIHTYNIGSGQAITNAQCVMPINSGSVWTAISSEAISGIKAVCIDITNSGAIRTAMAAQSGRMPAIGIVQDNVASGIRVNVITAGYVPFGSGIMASGYLQGKTLWVGFSGDLITLSGGYGSGGSAVLSGFMGQQMGSVHFTASGRTSGAYIINVAQVLFSGIPLVGQTPALYPITFV